MVKPFIFKYVLYHQTYENCMHVHCLEDVFINQKQRSMNISFSFICTGVKRSFYRESIQLLFSNTYIMYKNDPSCFPDLGGYAPPC